MNSPSLILSTFAKFMLIGFGGGMVVAAFEPQICSVGLARWRNGLLLGLYLAYLLIPGISGPGQILLLAAFALVVQGADLFGLLHNRAVRLLGDISYPVYLVHGIVFYAAMRLRGGIHITASSVYIAETAACLGVIFLLAAATHFLLERPTMRLSERLARHAALPPVTASG
jgi:peptidoglycan/LPS O-acetylase OafA/YrhL